MINELDHVYWMRTAFLVVPELSTAQAAGWDRKAYSFSQWRVLLVRPRQVSALI